MPPTRRIINPKSYRLILSAAEFAQWRDLAARLYEGNMARMVREVMRREVARRAGKPG